MTAPAISAPAKGRLGNGQLRRQVAEWLAARPGPHAVGELGGQRGEHGFRDRERIIRGNRAVRFHEGSSSFGPDGVATSELRKKDPLPSGFHCFP
jgi:hypothetical protein